MEDGGNGKTRYTLQCQNCAALETPKYLVLMETKFHTRTSDRRRLCQECRWELFARNGCMCDGCDDDRSGFGRGRR